MRDIWKCRIWNPHTGAFGFSGGTPMMQSQFFEQTATLLTVDGQTYEYDTGLQDKNGKDIYEEDIYKDAQGVVSRVRMAVDGWALFPVLDRRLVKVRSLYWHNVGNDTKGEVIGNKWDNLELLTGEKREESRR